MVASNEIEKKKKIPRSQINNLDFGTTVINISENLWKISRIFEDLQKNLLKILRDIFRDLWLWLSLEMGTDKKNEQPCNYRSSNTAGCSNHATETKLSLNCMSHLGPTCNFNVTVTGLITVNCVEYNVRILLLTIEFLILNLPFL